MRIGSLFSGAGGLDLAVESVFGGRTVWHCEQDTAASKVLTHRWPGVPNLGDITAVDWTRVEPVDVLCGGFPCFPAGTLIDAGEDGLRPIETLRVGDMVLTHERRRRAVTSVMRREAEDVLVIKAMGAPDFRATAEHPFYVLRGKNATSPEWVAAGELRSGDYLAMPLDDAGTEPVLGPHVAYVIGRWLGDGWIVDHKRTSDIVGKRGSRVNSRVHKAIICCADAEVEEVSRALLRAGMHATRSDERTVVKFHISSAAFVKALRPFGRGATGKRLPGWAFGLPQDERAALLQGWLDADGCRTQEQWKGATVSEELAHGMARLARSVHQRAVSVHRIRPPLTTAIEGREVNQRPWFQVVIPDRNKVAFFRGGFAWVPLRSVSAAPPCEVFNVSVDEDESYTAWGYTVHNCQDVSAAGRRAGIKDGTRSGLWSEYVAAIEELRPQFVVIENVRGLLTADGEAWPAQVVAADEEEEHLGRVVDLIGWKVERAVRKGYWSDEYRRRKLAESHRMARRRDRALARFRTLKRRLVQRAIGTVVADLAHLGYDAQWTTVSAASVGAPHRRERVFILATDTTRCGAEDQSVGGDPSGFDVGTVVGAGGGDRGRAAAAGVRVVGGADAELAPGRGAAAAASRNGRHEGRPEPARFLGGSDAVIGGDGPVDLLPTPTSRDHKGPNQRGDETCLHGALLPTPKASDHKRNDSPSENARNTPALGAITHYLPTPEAKNAHAGPDYARMQREGSGGHDLVTAIAYHDIATSQWGKYAPAIERWEALTRPAPSPTEPNTKGNPRLSAAFVEWMQGWPAGWVTDPDIGIGRNDQLRIIGNGVCPQQAYAAISGLLNVCGVAA